MYCPSALITGPKWSPPPEETREIVGGVTTNGSGVAGTTTWTTTGAAGGVVDPIGAVSVSKDSATVTGVPPPAGVEPGVFTNGVRSVEGELAGALLA